MTPERDQQIRELMESALQREAGEREDFLREACAGDESLRQQIESLIISAEQARSFLEMPATQQTAPLLSRASDILKRDEIVGPYRIISRLGAGGMGDVYLAEDTRLGRKIALKILSASFTRDADRVRRFRQEAATASALNHPNILTIHEVGESDSIHFMATEFIEGETLRDRLARRPMSLIETLATATQIASALSAAHAAGITHRDIKPENIMLRRDGFAKVLDFGIAKLTEKSIQQTDSNSESATRILLNTNPGLIMGTVNYMSPEQTLGLDIDSRSDIWSLGVVLYEMIAGRVPFSGPTMSHVMVAIQDRHPPPLTFSASEENDELASIVAKALNKDRAARFQNVADMLADLKSLQGELEFKSKLDQLPHSQLIEDQGTFKSPAEDRERANNLPVELNPLIGRDAEVRAIAKQLQRNDVRLLTLTGPGGTGKTRLSLQLASELLAAYSDGVFFIPLATMTDPNLVIGAIAQALTIKESGGDSLLDRLKDYLRDRESLLVIDNFEQVLPAGPLLIELLNVSRKLKILVSSRAPLHVTGEHEFSVPPLALPEAGQRLSVETLTRYSAIQLFVERARAVNPTFTLNDDNGAAIVEICARLDGLPLAIELAAARVKVLPPRALLARLENSLKLLMGGARDVPSRQQTMRGAIAWSYELLTDEDKTLFRRLSVFVGGFDLDKASALSADADSGVDEIESITALVDNSLLQRAWINDEPRFTMLQTITDYGREQLAASGEDAAVRRKHTDIFLRLAETAEQRLSGAEHEQWLDRLELEHDNFRAAMSWAAENAQTELGLRITTALWRFWEMRGYLTEGRARLATFLSSSGSNTPSKLYLKALYAAGLLADSQCDYQAARLSFQKNLELYRKLGDKWGIANSANNLGIIALRQHDYDDARALYEESLALWRELDNQNAVALSLGNLGNVADKRGDFAAARDYYEQSLGVFKSLKDARGVALSLGLLGDISRQQQQYQKANDFYNQSLAILSELGDKRAAANLLSDMGDMAAQRGDYDSTRPLYEEAMVIFSELGDIRGIARLLETYARMAATRGRFERALRIAGAAATLREEFGAPLPPDDAVAWNHWVNEIKETISDTASRTAWNEGKTMPTQRAIQYALAADTIKPAKYFD
ncbi:MAG: protein kinase [Pyrinomonadaceae bacterium]